MLRTLVDAYGPPCYARCLALQLEAELVVCCRQQLSKVEDLKTAKRLIKYFDLPEKALEVGGSGWLVAWHAMALGDRAAFFNPLLVLNCWAGMHRVFVCCFLRGWRYLLTCPGWLEIGCS